MYGNHRYPGLGLILLGLIIGAASALHHFGDRRCAARFERHIADVCVQAAQSVQK